MATDKNDIFADARRGELFAQLRDIEMLIREKADLLALTAGLRVKARLYNEFKCVSDECPKLDSAIGEHELAIEGALKREFLAIVDHAYRWATQGKQMHDDHWGDLIEVVEAMEHIDQGDRLDWSAWGAFMKHSRATIPAWVAKIITDPNRGANWLEVS